MAALPTCVHSTVLQAAPSGAFTPLPSLREAIQAVEPGPREAGSYVG